MNALPLSLAVDSPTLALTPVSAAAKLGRACHNLATPTLS